MSQQNTTQTTACPRCGLRYQCICTHRPMLDSSTQIALLTHPNETQRATNTGKLLTHSLSNCQVHIWDRVNPPIELVKQIAEQPSYLLFPSEEAIEVSELQTSIKPHESRNSPLFIILDGTWQEAKKMLNKSPWLQALPKVVLSNEQTSNYRLRRNQEAGNLCTCEVGISLLQQREPQNDFSSLQQYFELFLKVYEADKNHKVINLK
ncbi:tRNA-uridine aminocarboxypropyltransferase [Vibrio litoralis]|uniref:tRNA-uridine aminocarboxypropyltransferase n=1 Tax=Vibrio litoralis TaxID=335972 RepID=UPI00041E43DD|nr:DTW domain-containing protein [Vibrio litoralis]